MVEWPMALTFLKNGDTQPPSNPLEAELASKCQGLSFPLILEWKNGQYWLHSNNPEENPIGIEIDKILARHEDYFKRNSIQKELLARAVGVKGSYRPKVVDLTAGLLGDTLLFLSFGCEVTSIERHPVIAFLIQSALENAGHPALQRLKFKPIDAESFLTSEFQTDVIYFDPMFEDANQRTLPRKEMRIFRELVQEDQDAKEVFELALKKNPKRLVVKRPRYSQTLSELTPQQYLGKATRYDVYFSQNHGPFPPNPLK